MTEVEELKDAFLALLIISSTLDLKLIEWKSPLIFLGAGATVEVTYVHYCLVSRVKAWIPEGSVCILNGKIT